MLQLRGAAAPFLPQVRLEATLQLPLYGGGDKETSFDLSRLIKCRMEKLDPDERYTMYEADTGEDEDIFNCDGPDSHPLFRNRTLKCGNALRLSAFMPGSNFNNDGGVLKSDDLCGILSLCQTRERFVGKYKFREMGGPYDTKSFINSIDAVYGTDLVPCACIRGKRGR